MSQKISILIFLLTLLMASNVLARLIKYEAISEDTIPPRFINNPKGQESGCTEDYLSAFEAWYLNGANAVAIDNEDNVAIRAVISLEEARDSLVKSRNEICPDIVNISLQFFAIDACNNSSQDTLSATFKTANSNFEISQDALDTIINCGPNNLEELKSWVTRIGSAQAVIGCSDTTLTWDYFWTDNFNNSSVVFVDTRNPFNLRIPIDGCEWRGRFSFQAFDGCGNSSGLTTAFFTVIDESTPTFNLAEQEIEIDCRLIDELVSIPATDNCDQDLKITFEDDSSSQNTDTDDCGHYNYTISRNWTVTDDCGLQQSMIQNISLIDTIAPLFQLPEDITLDCILSNTLEITGNATEVKDNCDLEPMISFSDNASEDDCNQIITRFWEVMDACGNASILSQVISIIDSFPPTFTVPDDVVLVDKSNIETEVTGIPTELVDNCTLSPSIESRDSLNMNSECGEIIFRIWSATDNCGNTNRQVQRIVITNEVPPGFLVPADITIACIEDNTLPVTGIPTGIIVSCEPPLDPVFRDSLHQEQNCGVSTRFWTVEDTGGNQTTLSQKITIADEQAPSFDPPANIVISCMDQSSVENTGSPINLSENCGANVEVNFTDSLVQSFNCQDSIFRSWLITDECGNDTIWQQIIVVKDTIMPDFTAPDHITISCGELDDLIVIFPDATDNCSGEVLLSFSDSLRVDDVCQSQIERFWQGFDRCGNTNIQIQKITLLDTIAPVYSLPRDTVINCFNDIAPETLGIPFNISDNCSIDILVGFVDSIDVDMPCESAIRRFWTVTDQCGNANTKTQLIQILDEDPPEFDVPEDLSFTCLNDDSPDITGIPLNIVDNCLIDGIPSFNDEVIVGENCVTTINRTWTLRDNCGNETSKLQKIVSKDTTAPVLINEAMSIELYCHSNNVDSLYKNWLRGLGGAIATDACGIINSYKLDSQVDYMLNDPLSLELASVDTNLVFNCTNLDSNLVFQKSIDFVFQDLCSNSVLTSAIFQLRDSIAPSFSDTLQPTLNYSISEACEIEVLLKFPKVLDHCNQQSINKTIILNANELMVPENDSVQIVLESGTYQLMYIATDCANNQLSFLQQIVVKDDNPAQIVCPENIVSNLDSFSCSVMIDLPRIEMINDDCPMGTLINLTEPNSESESFLKFQLNESSGKNLVLNRRFEFTNIASNALTDPPLITLYIQANFQENNSSFTLFGENGFEIANIAENSMSRCDTMVSLAYELPNELFNKWAEDGTIEIDLINNIDIDGRGVAACGELNDTDEDGFSLATLSLSYQTSTPMFFTQGATSIAAQSFPVPNLRPQIDFELGNTRVFYVTGMGELADTCMFEVLIQDTISPIINCNSIVANIDPRGIDQLMIDSMFLIRDVSDNCSVDRIEIDNQSFDCQNAGDSILIEARVFDTSENMSTCDVVIAINEAQISPSYTAGVCPGDSLQLFSNIEIPEGSQFQFLWSGPNNFLSIMPNPVIQNATNINSGTYTLQFGGINGCDSEASIEVDIEQIPIPEIGSVSEVVCVGSVATLNATDFSGEVIYEWFESGALFAQTTRPIVEVIPSLGNRNYTVRVISDLCISETSITFQLEVINAPIIEFTESFIRACVGDDVQIGLSNGNSNISYEWFGPNNFSSDKIFPDPIDNIDFNDQGIYEVVAQIGGCKSDTFSTQIVVFAPPEKAVIEADEIYCTGSDVDLSVHNSVGIRYQWFQDQIPFAVRDTNVLELPAANMNFNGFWTVVVDDGLCQSDTSDAFQLIIEESNNISINSNAPVCQTDSIRLNVVNIPEATYVWEGPAGLTSSLSNAVFPPIAGAYKVLVTSSNSCTSEGNINIEVVNEPIITAISANDDRCVNGTDDLIFEITVFPADEYSYSWTGPNDFTFEDSLLIIPNIEEANEGTYTLTIANEACSSESKSIDINVTDIPPAPIIEGNSIICRSSDLSFTAELSEMDIDSFLWNTPIGDFISSTPMIQIVSAEIQNQGGYSMQWYRGSCISEESNTINLEVLDAPPAPVARFNGSTCTGENIELFTDAIAGATYEWRGPNNFSSNLRNPILTDVDNEDEGQYSVRIIIDDCISAWSEAALIDVTNQPDSPRALSRNEVICLNSVSDIQLCIDPASAVSGVNYIWKRFGEDEALVITNLICARFDKSLLETNPQEIVVFAELNNCLSPQSNVTSIFFEAEPTEHAQVDENEIVVCDDEAISLMANLPDGTQGEWTATDTDILIDEPINNITLASDFNIGDSEIIWSLSTLDCGIYSTDTLTLSRPDNPILMDDNLSAEFNGTIIINPLENDILPDEYTFEVIEKSEQVEVTKSENLLTIDLARNLTDQTILVYEVCVEACPDLCETARIIISITENNDCRPTNLITPNNDGINDVLFVPCIVAGDFKNNHLIIFNQWGDEIFNAEPYVNNWNGTYKAEILPVGTYYYIFNLGDGSDPMSGFIVLEL